MVTFTVKNGNGQVYKFSKADERYTFGSPLAENGVARKGRPSKFATENVTMSEVVETKEVVEVKPEPVSNENSVDVPAPVVDTNETERVKSENFLPLE